MIRALYTIRLKQGLRIVNDLGIGRFLFLIIIYILVSFPLFLSAKQESGIRIAVTVILLLLLFIQTKRKDIRFLKSHVENYHLLLFVEYLLISIPLVTGLLYFQEYLMLLLLVSGIALIGFVNRPTKTIVLNTFLQRLIPDECFEWKSGIRSSMLYLVPVWLAGLLTSFWIGSIPVALVIIGIATLGFTENNEPLTLLQQFEKGPGKLLNFKIKNQLMLFSVITIPLLLVYLLLHIEYWYIAVAIYLIFLIVNAYAILCKYAFYQPNTRSAGQLFNIFGTVSAFLPFLLPVVLFLIIRFWFRSVSNLKPYLEDFD